MSVSYERAGNAHQTQQKENDLSRGRSLFVLKFYFDLRRQAIDVRSKPGFVTGCCVGMKHAFLSSLVYDRDGACQKRARFGLIARFDCCAQALDLRAKSAAVAAIHLIAPLGLFNSFLC